MATRQHSKSTKTTKPRKGGKGVYEVSVLDLSRTRNAAERSLVESYRYIRSRHTRSALLLLAISLSSGSFGADMDNVSLGRVLGVRHP